MADAPKTVKVEALEWHTHQGEEHNIGDTYDIDEQLVDSVQAQGKAVRVDRVAVAKEAAKAAEKTTRARAQGKTAVEPMTTDTTAAAAATPARRAAKSTRARSTTRAKGARKAAKR